jgi:ribonuclease HII
MVRKLLFKPENIIIETDLVAGVDECGVGSGAGPVVAAAVILPSSFSHPDLNDSKQMTKKQREFLYPIIIEKAFAVGIGVIHNNVIDEINILNATFKAMHKALDKLETTPEFILVDGDKFKSFLNIPFKCIPQGDAKIISIAAASVVAKVYRDRFMVELGKKFPNYGWSNNAGYLTKEHREAIMRHGLTPLHRRTFIKDELLIKTQKLF